MAVDPLILQLCIPLEHFTGTLLDSRKRSMVSADELDMNQGTAKRSRFDILSHNDDASIGGFDEPVDEAAAPFDRCIDQGDNSMQPRPPSRVIHSVRSLKDQRTHLPLDVDSFAESLLHGDLLQGLSHILASATTVKKRKGFVDANKLAKNWKIGKEAAQRTLDVTTQRAV